jgi:RNA polymerase sigma factor (sigma-70 family)
MSIKKYEYKGVPFSAWLFRIAFNEINMYFRKNKADRIVSLEQSSISNMITEAETDDNTEAQQKMMLALKHLNEAEMQLIELRFFEKRSFAEVGVILDITENNAKVKVYRILDKLKGIISQACTNIDCSTILNKINQNVCDNINKGIITFFKNDYKSYKDTLNDFQTITNTDGSTTYLPNNSLILLNLF